MAKGAFWTILFRIVTRGIGLISTIVLARLLIPADFGLVAMAMTIIATFDLLGSFSLDVVLIQKANASREHYDTVWTFNVIVSALQGALLFVVSPLAADFYHDPRLTLVIQLLALGVFVQGFENIGILAFRKDLEFHKDFKFQVLKKLSSFLVTITLAIWLRNYWALIGGSLVGIFMGVVLSYYAHHYRPKLSFVARGELFHFSKWLFINNLIAFLNSQSPNFILGKVSGSKVLGLYSISYEISTLPTSDLVAPINRAIFPGYSKMAHDLATLRQGFLNVISVIALVALPVCTGIVLVAEPLVRITLGDKWLETIPLIQILAVAGLTQALQTNKSSVYLALGKPKILTILAAIHCTLSIPAVVFGAAKGGALGAAYAITIVSVFLMPLNYLVLFKVIKLPLFDFIKKLWRPIIATLIMILFVEISIIFRPVPETFVINLINLIFEVIVGCVTYSGSILILWKISGMEPGVELMVSSQISRRLRSTFKKY
jgi:O-antigen/teichoic acid export membrane protein